MTKRICKLGIGGLAVLMLLVTGCGNPGQESSSETETTLMSTSQMESTSATGLSEISHAVCEPAVREGLGEDFPYYEVLINGILAGEETVSLSGELERDQRILEAVQSQSPYYELVTSADIVKGTVKLVYSFIPEEHAQAVRRMDQEFLTFLQNNIAGDQNEFEQLVAVYKGIVKRFAIDYDYMAEGNQGGGSILQAVESGQGSPHAYARFCVFILGQLGVEAFCAESSAGDIWFIAEIDGNFYHFDPVMEAVNNNGSGLMFFAMSDNGRNKNGNYAYTFAGQEKSDFRDLTCSSERFENFRKVSVTQEEGAHLLRLYTVDELDYLYHTDTMTAEELDPERLAEAAITDMYPVFDSIVRTMEEDFPAYAPEDDAFVWGVLYRMSCNYGYLSDGVTYPEDGGIEIPGSAMREIASAAFGENTEVPAIPSGSRIQYQAAEDLYILPGSDMSEVWLQVEETLKQDNGSWVVLASTVVDNTTLSSYRFVCEPNSYRADSDAVYRFSVTSVTRR